MAIAVARFLHNGGLDPSFGACGIVRTNFPRRVAKVVAVAILAHDRFVVIGTDGDNLLVASYFADGRLNPAFSQAGRITLSFPFIPQDPTAEFPGQVVEGEVAAAGPAGPPGLSEIQGPRIVAVGETGIPLSGRFTLARYHPFDRLDPTFGPNGGFVFTDFHQDGSARRLSVDVNRDQRTAAAGSVRSFDNGQTRFAVARYLPNGP